MMHMETMYALLGNALINAAIDGVKTEALIDFVKDKGWSEYEQKRQDIKIFSYEEDNRMVSGFHQITIPLDKSLGDYNQAILRVLSTLSKIYDTPILDLFIRLSYVK